MSGGPLVDVYHRDIFTPEAVGTARAGIDPRISRSDAHWAAHGVQAQNYHIFTPPGNKDWAHGFRLRGVRSRICPTPTRRTTTISSRARRASWCWSSGSRRSTMRGCDGPQRAVESVLTENKLIGLSWCVIDYDDVNSTEPGGFWNLSHKQTFFGNARTGGLPADAAGAAVQEAHRGELVVQGGGYGPAPGGVQGRVRRQDHFVEMGFRRWRHSTEQNPMHEYKAGREYTVILDIEGPAGTARREGGGRSVEIRGHLGQALFSRPTTHTQ